VSDPCPHDHFRDVETCAICEAEEERDEARNAAREILMDSVSWDVPSYQKLAEGVWKAFPWLLDRKP
jgi:hypothetical protein